MRRFGHLLLFSVALLVALVATIPMRMLGTLAFLPNAGISAGAATGTIWHGQLLQVGIGAVDIGNVDASLSAWALLGGTTALRLSADAGTATVLSGRQQGVRAATGSWPLVLPTASGMIGMELQVSGLDAVFKAGRCVEAKGNVTVLLTLAAASAAGGVPPRLAGELECRDALAVARLVAESGQLPLEVTVEADGSGHYRLQWFAPDPAPEVRSLLALSGFQAGPGGMSRVDEGNLRP